jgi:hypothetical protein
MYQTELAPEHEHIQGFLDSNDRILILLRTRFSEALFVDPRLREKDLLIKGRLFPRSFVFEVMRIRSIREGVVQDLYYDCTVCNVETISAGPCVCCQGPVDLRERPIRARHGPSH